MAKTYKKFVCLFLALVLTISNLPTAFAAEAEQAVKPVESATVYNPLYEGVAPKSATTYARRFYSDAESDEEIEQKCAQGYDAQVVAFREGMEDRDPTIPLYVTTQEPLGDEAFSTLVVQLQEEALEETDTPTQGDYLRWVWASRHAGASGFYSDALQCYCYKITVNMGYYTSAAQEEELTEEVEEVIEEFGFTPATTDATKIATIYSYITENVRYDYTNLNNEDHTLKYTAYAALINGTAVCQGYAVLYYRMAEMCGVDSRVITGYAGGPHAWNISKIEDYYYYLDTTWDEGQTAYNYFLRGKTDFPNHTDGEDYATEAFVSRYSIAETRYTRDPYANPDDANFSYQITDGYAIITGYKGKAEHVVVPSYLGEYPVRYITETALNDKTFIKTITISEGVRGIIAQTDYMTATTFSGCNSLTALYLPTTFNFTYDKLGDGFYAGYTDIPNGCPNLATISVAKDSVYLKTVDGILYSQDGKYLVACPQNLQAETVTVPAGVEEICPTAFANNNNIKTLVFGDDVKTIGFEAFIHGKELSTITLSSSLESILGYAFMGCEKLESLHIPENVSDISETAFDQNDSLKTITVDSNNKTYHMSAGALLSDTQLVKYFPQEGVSSYTVPEGVLFISAGAFANAPLKTVALPEGLLSVGSYAFRDSMLEHLEFPASTETVGLGAFMGCDRLVSLIIPGNVGLRNRSYEGSSVNGLYLHENCTIYGEAATEVPPEGYVTVSQFCASNGYSMKNASLFACTGGHSVEKTILQDNAEEESRDYIYTYRCSLCGCQGKELTVQYRDLYPDNIALEFYEVTYSGSPFTPKVLYVKYDPDHTKENDEIILMENVDYTVSYRDNIRAGTAWVDIDGLGIYKGNHLQKTFEIRRVNLENLDIRLEYTSIQFDGSGKKPKVTVPGAVEGVDYDVSYYNWEYPGTASVYITAKNDNYAGSVQLQYQILPAQEVAVENLRASFLNYNHIELIWDFSPWVNQEVYSRGYTVYYKKATDSEYTLAGKTEYQAYPFPNLESNTEYDFKVVKYITVGEKEYTENEEAYVSITTGIPLTQAENVTATLSGTNTVTLTWKPVPGAHGYQIYMQAGEDWHFCGETEQCSFRMEALSYQTMHTFKVLPYHYYNYQTYLHEAFSPVSVTTLKEFDFIFEDGKYYYYAFGQRSHESGPYCIENQVYYLDDGAWVQKNLFVGNEYYENGIRKYEKTGVVTVDGEYCLVTGGVLDTTEQLVEIGCEYYYFKDGRIHGVTQMLSLNGVYYYLKDGRVVHTFTSLAKPETVTAKLTGYNGVTVSWSAVKNATHYKVYYRNISNKEYTVLSTTTALSYQRTGLASSATYEFKIVPCTVVESAVYEGNISAVVQIITARNLSAPKTVTAKLNTYNSATVSWSKVSYATHYRVYYRSVKSGSFKLLKTTTVLSYKKTGLASSTAYEFKIVPCIKVNGAYYEDSSTRAVQITTAKNLSAPKTVTAKLYGYDDIKVSWSKVSGANAYRVYYRKSSTSKYTLKTTTTKTSYSFPNLSDGVKYYFKIVPCLKVNGGYFADDSYKTAATTTLKKVSAPTVSRATSTKVTVKWTNIAGEKGYQISKSTSKKGTSVVSTYATTSGKKKTVSAARKKTYYYKVRAYTIVDGKKIYGPWSAVKAYKLK